jgi:hypothetical protein
MVCMSSTKEKITMKTKTTGASLYANNVIRHNVAPLSITLTK